MNKNLTIEEYLCNEDNNKQDDPIEVFKLFVSNNPVDIQEIEKYNNKQSSLCGANVPQFSTTFQCFDCAPDPHHMYCKNCFELDYHIGHRAFYKRGVTGCCDCGDPSAIANTKSFCQLHREQQIDQQAEFNKIHPEIKQKLISFLESAFQIYFKYAETVQHQLIKIKDPALLQCYSICQLIQYNQLAALLQKNLRLQTLYEDSQKMLRANKIIIEFMLWLCKDRACFVLLLAQFLRNKIGNQQTYFEQYIKYSLDLDIVSLDEDKSFQSLLFILNIDENFRLYTQQVFFLQQNDLWRFYDVLNFDGSQIVQEFISYFEDFTVNGKFVQKENISVKLFQSYFKKAKSNIFHSKQIWHANYFSLIFQFVSEEFQQVQFTSPLILNLLQINTLLLNTVNQNSVQGSNSLYMMTNFFSLKFQYNYFIKSFKNTLNEIFPEYEQKELSYEELSQLPSNKFFLESIFQSYAQVQGFQSNEKQLLLVITEINTAFQYLVREAQQLEFMKECLKKYLASSSINQYGKLNLLKLLLHFGFKNISNYKNSPTQYHYLKDLYQQNLNENEQNFEKNLKILNTFIYRSGSMIDKYFTLVLSRFLVEKNFLNSQQFNTFLEQSMLRNNKEIYVDMKMIFERCVHNFVSLLRVPQEDYIQYAYFGECKDQLVCYDIAFIKIFIILYQQQAINDLITILQQRMYFQSMNWKNYYIEIVARVIGPDQSFYCLCAQLFSNEDLPKSMSFVLYQILSNIFIAHHYSEFKQIKKQFQQAHFSVGNLDQYILQFCELDESVNKLQMKTLDKITQIFQLQQNQPLQLYYEPLLFLNSIAIGSEINDYLAEQKQSKYFVMFGNGIQQMVDFAQLNNYNIQLFELFSNEPNLDFFMKELEETAEPKLVFQVTNRLVCANKVINQEKHKLILDKLSTIKMKLPADQNLISAILTENQQVNVEQKMETENKTSVSVYSKVNKMKAKFQQKISQFSQQESAQLNELNTVNLIDDVCSVCKLKLEEEQNFCVPILIQPNPAHKFFDIFSPEVKEVIFTNELNLLKISISSCRHKFHDKCLIDLNSSQVKFKYLPNWFQISCPICKQSSETRLPINKVKRKLQVDELESWLLLQQLNFGMKKYLQEKYGENKNQYKLIEIFLSLLTDLLFQFFIDIKEFIRQEKNIIFYNILDILKGLKINANECKVTLKKSDNVVLKILNLIIQTVCVDEHEIDLIKYIEGFQFSQQHIQQLLLCFGAKCENKIQQIQEQQLINSPMNRHELKLMIAEILKQNLGLTFKDFYGRFFYQTQCQFCKYISDSATIMINIFVCCAIKKSAIFNARKWAHNLETQIFTPNCITKEFVYM